MDQLPRLEKRELIYLLLFTCNYVVSVWRGFLFLWVLGMGYVILLWHSLSLPYDYIGNSLWLYSPVFVVIEPGGKPQNSYDLATSVRTYFRLCNHSIILFLSDSYDDIRLGQRATVIGMLNAMLC